MSSINGQLISEQLKEVFPATMELCILAFGFALMVGIPIGMLAGITRNKWQDRCISALALMGFSIPVLAGAAADVAILTNPRLVTRIRAF